MARALIAAVALSLGLLPLAGHALGLGEIRPRSTLGQPFAAEIPLAIDSPDELRELEVVLAPPETFARFGLDRPPGLAELRFSVDPTVTPPVIRVSSTRLVTEPFLSLLLEVTWPRGRLLREYTVLLDPPAFAGQATPAAAPPAVKPRPAARVTPAPPAEEPGAGAPGAGGSYTVVRGDTLSAIALGLRPDAGVSLNQVMLALYRANPEAFVGNINRLKAGAVLRLPSRDAMTGLGRVDADAEVRRQIAEWRSPSQGAADGARLQLVPPATGTVPTGAETGRLRQLEAELAETRRLLELRNRELQALQQRGSTATAAPAAETTAEAAVERLPGEEPVEPGPAAAPATRRPERPRAPTPPVDQAGGGLVDTVTGLVSSPWFLGAASLALLLAWLLYRRRLAGAETPQGISDGPYRLTPVVAAGGAEHGEEPFLVEEGTAATGTFASPDFEAPLERTISADPGLQLDQADPIAEADFHSAYGLHDQAAEILNRALRAEPDRRDLRLKLLEVYFGWENKAAFLGEARAFGAQFGSSGDADWRKVVIMGSQLCPGDPLFTGAAADGAGATLDLDLDLTGEQSVVEPERIDFDLGDPAAGGAGVALPVPPPGRGLESPTIEAPTLAVPDSGSLLDAPDDHPATGGPGGSPTIEAPTLESVAPGWVPGAQKRFPVDAGATSEIDLADLGLDLAGLDEVAAGQQAGPADIDLDLDFAAPGDTSPSLRGLDAAGGVTTRRPTAPPFTPTAAEGRAAAPVMPAGDETAELPRGPLVDLAYDAAELTGLDFGLDDDAASGVEPTATLAGGGGPDGPTMTEVGTKLDLARAYLDMGDPEGARSILNEVLEEGDPGQRQEARKLLAGLTG